MNGKKVERPTMSIETALAAILAIEGRVTAMEAGDVATDFFKTLRQRLAEGSLAPEEAVAKAHELYNAKSRAIAARL